MISVIVPFFNSEKYLSNLMSDLLRQTYSDLEIILVNDGSTDTSEAIIQRYVVMDNRIHYVRIDHSGVSAARNVGLKQAKGEYIRFIDADDRLDSNSMEKMLLAMEYDKKIDLVCGRFETNCANIVYFGPQGISGKRDIDFFIQDFSFAPRTFYYGVVWNKLYRRELIAQYNIIFDEDLDWCEDYLFNLNYYEHSKYIYYSQDSIYRYCVHDESLTSQNDERLRSQRFSNIDQYRYQKTIEFIERIGCNSKQFKDTWAYLKNMDELFAITSYFSDKGGKDKAICERYHVFKEMLSLPYNKNLIDCRYIEDTDIMIKIIYRGIKRERYISLFIFMIIKDFLSVHCPFLKKIWRKRKRKGGNL